MKKLLGILVLGLFYFNIGYANEIECPNNYPKSDKKLIEIPINFHILQINEKSFKTITTENDIKKDLECLNRIFSQVNITFFINDIFKPDAITKYSKTKPLKLKDRVKWFQKYEPKTKKQWDKIQKKLKERNKTYIKRQKLRGRFYIELIGWDKENSNNILKKDGLNYFYLPNMFPGDKTCASAIRPRLDLDKEYRAWGFIGHTTCEGKSARGIVFSHEMGHLLGLSHTNKNQNLMNIMYEHKGITKFLISEAQYNLMLKVIERYNLTFDKS